MRRRFEHIYGPTPSPQETTENGLSEQRKQEIRSALVHDKSAGERLYEWAYKDDPTRSGMTLYLATKNTPGYDLFAQEEAKLFGEISHELERIFLDKHTLNCVHLGPGDAKSWFGYIANLPQASKLSGKRYVPVDISDWACKQAGEKVQAGCHMISDPLVVDWLKTKHLRTLRDKAILFDGATLGNFNDGDLYKLLHATAVESGRGSRMAASFFVAPDKYLPGYEEKVQRILQGYKTPEVKLWIKEGLEEIGVDTSDLSLHVAYREGNETDDVDCVRVGVKVEPGCELRVSVDGNDRVFREGQVLRVISSRRFTTQQIKQRFAHERRHIDTIKTGEYVGVLTARSQSGLRQYVASHQQKIKTALLTALLTGGAWGVNQLWNNYTTQKKIEAKIAYNIQFKNADRYQDRFVTEYDTPEKKLERVKWLANEMVKILHIRYRDFAFPDDNELQNTLGLLISQGNNLDAFLRGDSEYEAMVHFLDEVFWPLYSTTNSDIEQAELYAHLKDYEGEMRETRVADTEREIPENLPSTDKIIPKWGAITPYHKLKKLGRYITSNGQKYDIAIGERRQATGYNEYRIEDKQFVARMARNDEASSNDAPYRVTDGKKVVQDYFKRGYADKLTHDLLLLIADKTEKGNMLSHRNMYRYEKYEYPLRELGEVLNGLIVRLNMQGYDFSYLNETGNDEMQKRFLFAFLPQYEGLTQHEKAILAKHAISAEQSETVSLSQVTTRLTDYLDTYFYAIDAQQNLFGLKKELVREMLQRSDNDWRYRQIKDDNSCFDYLYARKELCLKFGYRLQTWQDLGDYENAFRELLLGRVKDLGNETALPGDLNYFNNFYRCADGRVFSFGGNYHEMHALEITPSTSHRAIEQCLPEIADAMEKKRGKGIWSLQGSSRGDVLKNQQAVSYINQHYIPFTQDAATIVAQDYFEQKYGERISDELSNYLISTCAPGKKELKVEVKKLLSQTTVKLLLANTLSPREITTAQNSDAYRTTLLYYFLIPECKDALEKIMGMSLAGELPYAMTDQLKFVPVAVQEFMHTFGAMRNGMQDSESELSLVPEMNMEEFTEEQKKVAQTLLKIVSGVSSDTYDLKTHLGRYKFFMEHNELFAQLGYVYHNPYFGYLSYHEDEVLHQSKDNVLIEITPTMNKIMRFVVTPRGTRYQLIYTQNALGNDHIFARPVFTQQERAEKMIYLGIKFTERYGGGQVGAAQSDRVASQFDEKYVWWRLSHAQDLFKELIAVYGDDVFDRTRFMDDVGTAGP